jgi:hypothetical protein
MMRDRKAAELMAGTVALRCGRDPFEPALAAGIHAACYGRLFADGRPTGEHNRRPYALGFSLGRHCLLDVQRPALPSFELSAAILAQCEESAHALA